MREPNPVTGPVADPVAPAVNWTPAIVACLAQFMILVNVTVVNVALVVVESGLGLSVSALQWLAAGYPLTYGLVVIPAGRLGDVLGRRVMVALGLGTFVAGCVVGGLAWNSWSIVAARLLQGAAAGILNPQALSMLNDNYAGERRASAFAMFGATVGVATAIGPALGGLLLQAGGSGEDSWRLLFWSNIPLAVVLYLAARRVRFTPRARGSFDADVVGLLLIGVSVLGLIAPFVGVTPDLGWTVVAVVLAAGALVAGVIWERRYAERGRTPLLDPRMFVQPGFRHGVLVGGAYMAAMTSFSLVFSLYLQAVLRMSALAVGLMMIPFALGSAVSAVLGRKHVVRSGRVVVVWGAVLVVVGWGLGGLVAWLATGPAFLVLIGLTQLLAGAGAGLVLSPNQNLTLGAVDRKLVGAAGGVLQAIQRLGSTIGSSVGTAVFFAAVAHNTRDPDDSGHVLVAPIAIAVAFGFIVLGVSLYDSRRNRELVTDTDTISV